MFTRSIPVLLGICALAALVFLLNNMALADYFYWKYWWYDIMMHGLGGLIIGSCVSWFLVRSGYAATVSRKRFFIAMLAGTLLIGVGWEIMEYMNGFFIGQADIIADTTLDIIMDMLGGSIGFFLISALLIGPKNSSQTI